MTHYILEVSHAGRTGDFTEMGNLEELTEMIESWFRGEFIEPQEFYTPLNADEDDAEELGIKENDIFYLLFDGTRHAEKPELTPELLREYAADALDGHPNNVVVTEITDTHYSPAGWYREAGEILGEDETATTVSLGHVEIKPNAMLPVSELWQVREVRFKNGRVVHYLLAEGGAVALLHRAGRGDVFTAKAPCAVYPMSFWDGKYKDILFAFENGKLVVIDPDD